MAVDGVTCRPSVLARDTARFRPFLQEAGLVDDQHPTHRIAEMVNDINSEIVLHVVGVPDGRIQEALDTLRPELTDRLGQLPAVLAPVQFIQDTRVSRYGA